MNRKSAVLLILFLVLIQSGHSQDVGWKAEGSLPLNGTLEVQGSTNTSFVLTLTPDAKAVDLIIGSDEGSHRTVVGFLKKNDGRRDAFAFRGKHSFIPSILIGEGKTIFSESGLALGYLDGAYLRQGVAEKQFEFNQILYGYEQYIGLRWNIGRKHFFGIKGGGSLAGSNLRDEYGSLNQWDNHSLILSGFGHALLSDQMRLKAEIDGRRTRYNPERYFFVEKWTTEYEFRSELAIDASRKLEVAPLLNYKKVDIERNRRADLARMEYGGRVTMKGLIPAVSTAYVKGVYAPWRHKKGSEMLLAVGIQEKDLGVEVYQRSIHDVYPSFVLDERIVGAQVSWKFGAADRKELKGMDDYGNSRKQKFRFYRESGIQDVPQLTRIQQAERLGNVRKRNEWSGKNLAWKMAPDNGWGFRFQDDVYAGRAGDCDEQSCANGVMDAQNGYRNFTGAWWDFNKSFIGHGVELVQDSDTGEWFWDEYGQIYKIKNVGKNSNRDEVMREALKQNHRFSALPVDPNSDGIYYSLIDCSQPNTYNAGWFTWYGNMPSTKERPNVEYGYELFTGRNFLFAR